MRQLRIYTFACVFACAFTATSVGEPVSSSSFSDRIADLSARIDSLSTETESLKTAAVTAAGSHLKPEWVLAGVTVFEKYRLQAVSARQRLLRNLSDIGSKVNFKKSDSSAYFTFTENLSTSFRLTSNENLQTLQLRSPDLYATGLNINGNRLLILKAGPRTASATLVNGNLTISALQPGQRLTATLKEDFANASLVTSAGAKSFSYSPEKITANSRQGTASQNLTISRAEETVRATVTSPGRTAQLLVTPRSLQWSENLNNVTRRLSLRESNGLIMGSYGAPALSLFTVNYHSSGALLARKNDDSVEASWEEGAAALTDGHRTASYNQSADRTLLTWKGDREEANLSWTDNSRNFDGRINENTFSINNRSANIRNPETSVVSTWGKDQQTSLDVISPDASFTFRQQDDNTQAALLQGRTKTTLDATAGLISVQRDEGTSVEDLTLDRTNRSLGYNQVSAVKRISFAVTPQSLRWSKTVNGQRERLSFQHDEGNTALTYQTPDALFIAMNQDNSGVILAADGKRGFSTSWTKTDDTAKAESYWKGGSASLSTAGKFAELILSGSVTGRITYRAGEGSAFYEDEHRKIAAQYSPGHFDGTIHDLKNNEDSRLSIDYEGDQKALDFVSRETQASVQYNRSGDNFNLRAAVTGDQLARLLVARTNGLWTINTEAEGWTVNYREHADLREIMLTSAKGKSIILDSTDWDEVRHGNVNRMLEILENEFEADLNFRHEFNNGYVSFSQIERDLSLAFNEHQAGYNFNTRTFRYTSPDGTRLALAPHEAGIAITEGRYKDGFLALNLDNTFLSYDKNASTLGLYSDRAYLAKVTTVPYDVLKEHAHELGNNALSGDFDLPDTDDLIRDNISEVRLNIREIVRGRRLVFEDAQWNKLMTSLAWDMPEASITGAGIADIASSKNSDKALYNTLSTMLGSDPGAVLTGMSRNVSYSLASSIVSGPASQQSPALQPLGVTSFSKSLAMNFVPQFGSRSLPLHGFGSGCETGLLDLTVPGLAPYSRSVAGTSAYAERYYASYGYEAINSSSLAMRTGFLLYAYRFPDPIRLEVSDNFKRQFSRSPLYSSMSFDFDEPTPAGTVLPGFMASLDANSGDKWYVSLKGMPYVPITVEDDMSVTVKTDPAEILNVTQWATDIKAGTKGRIFNQTASLDIGRDVNGYFFSEPGVTLFEKLNVGTKFQGRSAGVAEAITYHTGFVNTPVRPTLFWEQNLTSLTDTYGLSVDVDSRNNRYNVSTGFSTWDNAGVNEVVERYIALGMDINGRFLHRQAVVDNLVEQNISWLTHSGLVYGRDRDRELSLDTEITAGETPELETVLRSRISF